MDVNASVIARELEYYRRECNDLGARLLRLQEEQSSAFREARRSRTVVKLLREAYRLGDLATNTRDVGGPMLELVVDNTLCDRAMLLREEPLGSGMFLPAQAIGLSERALGHAVRIASPPAFLHTAGTDTAPNPASRDIIAAMGVPYVLWAYDRNSGHALVVANRLETNASRPFEQGDHELIEAALSVYLDVLYRKHAEAILRQAKQAAEAAGLERTAVLAGLGEDVREPLRTIAHMAGRLEADARASIPDGAGAHLDRRREVEPGHAIADVTREIIKLSEYVGLLVDGAAGRLDTCRGVLTLDVEWLPVDELLRSVIASTASACANRGVRIETTRPRRQTAVLVDRLRLQHVVQRLVVQVMRETPMGGLVRLTSDRHSDGGLRILVRSRGNWPDDGRADPSFGGALAAGLQNTPFDDNSLAFARSVIDAHNGTLILGQSPDGGAFAQVELPAAQTRDTGLATTEG